MTRDLGFTGKMLIWQGVSLPTAPCIISCSSPWFFSLLSWSCEVPRGSCVCCLQASVARAAVVNTLRLLHRSIWQRRWRGRSELGSTWGKAIICVFRDLWLVLFWCFFLIYYLFFFLLSRTKSRMIWCTGSRCLHIPGSADRLEKKHRDC